MSKNSKYEIESGEHLNEVILSWIITHACQEKCAYCISPEKKEEIKSLEEHQKIQDHLIKTGLTKMRYIGGEPLLVDHIAKLIIDAKKKGLNTRLSTNGILLNKEKFEELKDYLDSVALPFESTDDVLNRSIRCTKHHKDIVTDRIKMIKENSDIGVLVNTCVHRENIGELIKTGQLLSDLGVDHWKLRKFNSAYGRGAVPNKERFEITNEEFFEIVDTLQALYPNLKIDGRLPEKLNSRLMVNPQGELYRMEGENEINYGKVLEKKLNIKDIYLRDNCS